MGKALLPRSRQLLLLARSYTNLAMGEADAHSDRAATSASTSKATTTIYTGHTTSSTAGAGRVWLVDLHRRRWKSTVPTPSWPQSRLPPRFDGRGSGASSSWMGNALVPSEEELVLEGGIHRAHRLVKAVHLAAKVSCCSVALRLYFVNISSIHVPLYQRSAVTCSTTQHESDRESMLDVNDLFW